MSDTVENKKEIVTEVQAPKLRTPFPPNHVQITDGKKERFGVRVVLCLIWWEGSSVVCVSLLDCSTFLKGTER